MPGRLSRVSRVLRLPTWLILPRRNDAYCPCCSKETDGEHAALCSLYGRALLIDPAYALMQPDHPVFYVGSRRRIYHDDTPDWRVDMRRIP